MKIIGFYFNGDETYLPMFRITSEFTMGSTSNKFNFTCQHEYMYSNSYEKPISDLELYCEETENYINIKVNDYISTIKNITFWDKIFNNIRVVFNEDAEIGFEYIYR